MTLERTNMGRRRKNFILKLVAGTLLCLLLFRVDFLGQISRKFLNSISQEGGTNCHGANCRQAIRDSPNILHRMMEGDKEEAVEPTCDIPHLKNTIYVKPEKNVSCVRSPPSKASCRVVQEMFGDLANPAKTDNCRNQPAREYCHTKLSDGQFQVHCNLSYCGKQKDINLGVYDMSAGMYKWKTFQDASTLETAILDLTRENNPGYCLISCGTRNIPSLQHDPLMKEFGFKVVHPQVVNLPPYIAKTNHKPSVLDFNIVFVDSTSRHHFFRTLPQTRTVLERLLQGSTPYHFAEKTLVLDYSLMQGVRSRTYETLETLFSGYIKPYEKTFGIQAMPDRALRLESLFKPLKKLGYQTLWLEDLCPLWEWGLSKDLLAYDKNLDAGGLLENLRKGLDKAGIDSIGNALSNCVILHANDVPDPFHGPDQICFNGRHQHEYQFDYLKLFQQTMLSKHQPFFTFLETNIGHDDSGRRISLLDSKLAEYLNFAKSMPNTLTILMSDHGNSYGQYFDRSEEGRVEIYQPFLFLIIPENVQHFITESKMQALLKNQVKLTSVLDLHYMLQDMVDVLHFLNKMQREDKFFTNSVFEFNQEFHITKQGLMGNISESRSCSIVPRIMPNLCICKDFEIKRTKFPYYYILALFALGELNNNIQTKRRLGTNGNNLAGGFGHCVRLKLSTESIKSLQESEEKGDTKSVTMDMNIFTPVQKQPDIFLVSLRVKHGEGGKIGVLNYDRMSVYSKYSVCADQGVPLSLCICDLRNSSSSVIYNYTYDYMDVKKQSDAWKTVSNPKLRKIAQNIIHKDLKIEIKELTVMGSKCIGIVMGSNEVGVVAEGINVCNVAVKVSAELKTEGLALSTSKQLEVILYPGDITFLVAGLAEERTKWTWEMNIGYTVVKN